MSLEKRIYDDFIKAFKEKDEVKKVFLSYLRAELKNRAKFLKKDSLTDAEVVEILQKQKKKIEEAERLIASSAKEEARRQAAVELDIVKSYLPEPASEEEMQKVVAEVIREGGFSGMKDMGAVMKEVLSRLGARADKAALSNIVRSRLSAA